MATTQLTFTIDSTLIGRVITAYTTVFGYSATLTDGTPNPETTGQFTHRMIAAQIAQFVRHYEDQSAAGAAVAGGTTIPIT